MSKSLKNTKEVVTNIDNVQINSESPTTKKEKLIIGDYTIKQDDLFLVGDAEIDANGLVDHHISSANDLYTNGITHNITQVFTV
jgi:hypothetical protein